ncbi:hypothetical protein M1373_03445 [Candidatus Marsarchaeota archaeon]|nr:hypothetical protein [Candidatus Marsarchaeota archaeon]MCL5404800.1 hypothetical protein [Candidatus Marsarchaeota archaeon]
MRFLCWHVDYFNAVPKEHGRSSVIEQGEPLSVGESLLLFISFDKGDELRKEDVIDKATAEIQKIAAEVKVGQLVLNPFAHLFSEPAPLQEAAIMLSMLNKSLLDRNFTVHKMAFGVFYEIELKAKGHRLARVSRSF